MTEQAPPSIIVIDVGSTHTRFGILSSQGVLLDDRIRIRTPGAALLPDQPLGDLQNQLIETLAQQIEQLRLRHPELGLNQVGIAIGVAITRQGIVMDASVLWHQWAQGFDLASALRHRLDGLTVWIQNDAAAMAWRHYKLGRFILYTISTGVSCKVFDRKLTSISQLVLDDDELGGELGHVSVAPEKGWLASTHAQSRAQQMPTAFSNSLLVELVGSAHEIQPGHLGLAAMRGDPFAQQLLHEVDVPYCECGNLADLCSYSSGPAIVRAAQRMAQHNMARFQESRLAHFCNGQINAIDTYRIAEAAKVADPLTEEILEQGTYFLALSILQLCAALGLNQVVISGGFANGVGQPYFEALHRNLTRHLFPSGFFTNWTEADLRSLILPCADADNDALIGIGLWVQAQLNPQSGKNCDGETIAQEQSRIKLKERLP